LAVLGEVLESFTGTAKASWPKSDLYRLTTLIAQAAFQAGVDIDDWLNLGRPFPVLAAVLNLEHRWHWLQVHALWLFRDKKPWQKIGPALDPFDLADSHGHEEILAYYPDVLLYSPRDNLVIGSKGVWIEGVCVTSAPQSDAILLSLHGVQEIQVGNLRIPCGRAFRTHLNDIQNWLNWYFRDFLPTVPNTPQLMVESRHRLWQQGRIVCPECNRWLFPCAGDLGVLLK
jgi:hypothetical protein